MITDDMTDEDLLLLGFRPLDRPAPAEHDETPEEWDRRDRSEQMTRDERGGQ